MEALVVVVGQAYWEAAVEELLLDPAGTEEALEQRYRVAAQPVGQDLVLGAGLRGGDAGAGSGSVGGSERTLPAGHAHWLAAQGVLRPDPL
jgi:hypothetical protein